MEVIPFTENENKLFDEFVELLQNCKSKILSTNSRITFGNAVKDYLAKWILEQEKNEDDNAKLTKEISKRNNNSVNKGKSSSRPKIEGLPKKKCKLCDYEAKSVYGLTQHRRQVHHDILKCDLCNKIMRSKISLHVHYKTEHPNGNDKVPQFNCDLCDHKSKDAKSLRAHLKHSHVENGPFHCQICNKEYFGGFKSFKNHLKLHTNDKDFQCMYCDKLFINKSRLSSHLKAIHNPKSWQCEYCAKLFNTKFALERHSGIAHNETNIIYQCSICDYQTYFMGNLSKHVQNVHNKPNFRTGRVLKGSRKILGVSGDNYGELMTRKSQDMTVKYLKEFSDKSRKTISTKNCQT